MYTENLFLALSGVLIMYVKPIHVKGFTCFLPVEEPFFGFFRNKDHHMQHNIHRFYRLREVTILVGLSRATIYRLIKQGSFPAGISLTGSRAVGWSELDLAQWMNARLNNAQ